MITNDDVSWVIEQYIDNWGEMEDPVRLLQAVGANEDVDEALGVFAQMLAQRGSLDINYTLAMLVAGFILGVRSERAARKRDRDGYY